MYTFWLYQFGVKSAFFSSELLVLEKFLMKNCIYHSFFFCSILNVSAIVLANLCVSYIMTSQNEEAEELMRKIEKEEEQVIWKNFLQNFC